jgi:hypothetical protein
LPKKAKRNQQSTRLWLLLCFSSVKWCAWIPALTNNKKGSSSLNKLDNKPDCFFLYNRTVERATSHHRKSTMRMWRMSRGYTVEVVVALHEFFCICANDICNRLLICNVWLLSTLTNNNKIN